MKIQMALVGFTAIMLVAACNKQPGQTSGNAAIPAQGEQSAQPVPTTPGAPAVVVKTCNVEKVDAQEFKPSPPMVTADSTVRLSGWIIDERSTSVPGKVTVQLVAKNGGPTREQPVTMWRDRPDVARAHNSDAYLKSGFSVDVNLKGLPAGDYVIGLLSEGSDGVSKCDVGRRLVIM
jgi:hypothetical protein